MLAGFRVVLLQAAALLLVLGAQGCFDDGQGSDADTDADSDTDTDTDSDGPLLWDAPDLSGLVLPDALAGLGLGETSSWGEHVDKVALADEQGVGLRRLASDPMQRGFFAIGNGRVFAFTGVTFPLNTLHDLTGPTMQNKSEGFFADVSVDLGPMAGTAYPFEDEWVVRFRGSPLVVTRGVTEQYGLALTTLDIAPRGLAGADAIAEQALVRVIVVENLGAEPLSGVSMFTTTASATEVLGDHIRTARNQKLLEYSCLGGNGCTARAGSGEDKGGLLWSLDGLEPGAERTEVLVFGFAADDTPEDLAAARAAVERIGWPSLLEQTRTWWSDWLEGTTVVSSPDPRVNDLLEGLKLCCKLQQTAQGATTPMSHYTSTWTRDQIGWLRQYLAIGAFDDAAALIDYSYAAARYNGGLYNAADNDLDPSAAPDPPDWASLPKGSGRTAGEAPSYIPLTHDLYYRYTGESDRLIDRLAYLRYCIDLQQVSEEGLVPFSGDETFRTNLALNLGLDALYEFENLTYSANSGFLYVVGAEAVARAADLAGDADAAAAMRTAADEVRAATETRYWLTDGDYYSPFIYIEGLLPEEQPFEDVSCKPLWLEYHGPDDPRAAQNIAGLRKFWDRGDGFVVGHSDSDTELLGIEIGDGIYTGMTPGYVLYALTALDDPYSEAAFNALGPAASRSGNFPEDQVYAGGQHVPAQPFYFPTGGQGEIWARYRAWEGGINADAALFYLLGLRVDCPARALELGPRLPNQWPELEVQDLHLCPGEAMDLRLERKAKTTWRLTLTPSFGAAAETLLTLRPPASQITEIRVDGAVLAAGEYTLIEVAGLARATLAISLLDSQVVVEADYLSGT